jgi:hypothetical protein
MNYIELSGGNFEVGYGVGRWWAKYFLINRLKSAIKTLFKNDNYFNYLHKSWDINKNIYAPLLRNTMRYYPEVIEEISGIEKGVCDYFSKSQTDLKIRPTFLDIFCLCLGEDDVPGYNCSSAVVKMHQGYFLAHNDEFTRRYPLLVAKVQLKTLKRTKRFLSISYPFQLLGSSAGMNASLAFSGNSIGCKEQYNRLRKTMDGRIPKTVFSRNLLEVETIAGVETLFSKHHSTLPNHHYIISKNKAVSIEIRPRLNPSEAPRKQLLVNSIKEKLHFHTNHFLLEEGFDMSWNYNRDGERDSRERYKHLSKFLSDTTLPITSIKKFFRSMGQASDSSFRDQTSASLFFHLNENRSAFEGEFYFKKIFKKKCSILKRTGC